ncbi:DUF7677 family protein [Microlunatus speluncae]|uniref:DUF7677 family protein n=1 Tax=Microlunatus speluncae TaxID=2594267 RepID=UPI001C2DE503|nr:hypothetical protein [Microlunatus speluncae]
MTTRLSHSFSGALRTFSFWVANGTLGLPVLEGIDYQFVLAEEPSALEQVYAIFANVIVMDDDGTVLNAKYAERRAAEWLRSYVDPNYSMEPELEHWERALHEAPPREDPAGR